MALKPMTLVKCPRCGWPGIVRKYHSGTGLLIYVEHVEGVGGSKEVRARCYLGWAYRLRRDDRVELAEASRKWWECVVGRPREKWAEEDIDELEEVV